jgi:hypothetical protein
MKLTLVREGTWCIVEQTFGGKMNIQKAEEYDKKSSKAMVMMMNYLSDDDNMATQDCNTAWEMWVVLEMKSQISASGISTASIHLAKIVRFHEDFKFGPTAGVE